MPHYSILTSLLLALSVTHAAAQKTHSLCSLNPKWTREHAGRDDRKKPLVALHAIDAVFAVKAYRDKRSPNFYLPPDWQLVEAKALTNGLAWVAYKNDVRKELVVAFRGTEFDSAQDWIQNLANTQSKPARRAMGRLLKAHEGYRARAVGHSLGGALALEQSHWFRGIDATVFQTAPLVAEFRGPRAYRVHIREKWEPLSLLRGNPSQHPDWGLSEDLVFNFTRGFLILNPLSQHNMERLAMNLVKLASSVDDSSAQMLERACGGAAR